MKHKIVSVIGYYLLGLFLLSGIAVPASAKDSADAYSAEDCMECHRLESGESSLQISLENYEASPHGRSVTCLACHTGITGEEHMDGEGAIAVDCSICHEMETEKINFFSIFSSPRIVSHPKADFSNGYEMDNCLGCHQGTGAHGETEPINDQECYKCHAPGMKNAMWGNMHQDKTVKALPIALLHLCFAVFLLVLVWGRFLNPVNNRSHGNINKKQKR